MRFFTDYVKPAIDRGLVLAAACVISAHQTLADSNTTSSPTAQPTTTPAPTPMSHNSHISQMNYNTLAATVALLGVIVLYGRECYNHRQQRGRYTMI